MRKQILRSLSLLFALLMIFGAGPQVFALNFGNGTVSADSVAADGFINSQSIGDYEGLKTYLYNKVSACTKEISISSYNIAYTEENAKAVFSIIRNEFPEFFHVGEISITYSDNYLKTLSVTYKMTKANYNKALTAVNAKADYLLRDIAGSSLSDAEKVLLVHDRLAVYAEYDVSANHEDDTYTLYGTVINGVAVCEGYARTFVYLMKKLGIQARTITSSKLNHTWNIVTIGGKEYHVDVTWDDKYIDAYGRVFHDNVLRSTAGAKNTGHNATDYTCSATDTTYDKYYWINSIAEFQLFKGKLYFVNSVDNTLRERTTGTSSTVLATLEEKWSNYYMTPSNGNMVFCFAGLSSDSNYLYYTSPTAVLKFDITTKTSETVYTPKLPGSTYKIYGFKAYNGKFYLDINNTPGMETTTRKEYGVTYPYIITYTIIYNANGGTNVPESAIKEQGKTIKISSVVPTRTGYTFEGWSENISSTTAEYKPEDDYTKDCSANLYAVWSANSYQVYFDANTGSCATGVKAVAFDSKYGTLPTPTKTGCDFVGWYTSLGSDGKLITKDSVMNTAEDHTLYAVWKGESHIITFNPNGGSVTPTKKQVNYGSNVELPTPQKTNCKFVGWYDEEGNIFKSGSMYNYTNDIILTAHWEAGEYTVYFDANGGEVSTSEKTVTYQKAYGELPVPERPGYDFLGWYTAKEGGSKITETSLYNESKNTTLYAVWKGKEYILYFDAIEGKKMTVTYGEAIGELPEAPIVEGKTFIGWYVDGVKITAATVCNFNGNKLAVAKWYKTVNLKINEVETSTRQMYGTTIVLTPGLENADDITNKQIRWIIDGDDENYLVGSKLRIIEAKKTYDVKCQLVVDGEVIAESQEVTIIIKRDIFSRLIYRLLKFFGVDLYFPKNARK